MATASSLAGVPRARSIGKLLGHLRTLVHEVQGHVGASAWLVIARAKVAVLKTANCAYSGKVQVGVPIGVGYKLTGTPRATEAGTSGLAKRLEATQILILPKGSKAPAANNGGYR